MDKKLKAIVEAWKGGARISDLETEHGIKRSRIRRMIQKAVGGKDAFRQLRETGTAGGTFELGGHQQEYSLPDDSKVKRITSAKHKMVGGKWDTETGDGEILVHVSPTGERYVVALTQEKADLLYKHSDPSMGVSRLRLLETSAAARKARKKAKQRKRGEVALKAKRVAKREKRRTRKGARRKL